MSVKIYSLPSDLMSPPVEDSFVTDFVLASDYAELQRKFEALAVENATLKSGVGFFSYNSDDGFDSHRTADEAIKAADAAIDYYRGDACDGWSDETGEVCWGVIMQKATMTDLHTETYDSGQSREICDYALLPPVETPATDSALADIRIQGVGRVRDYHSHRYEALKAINRKEANRHAEAMLCANDVIEQIRNEASNDRPEG